MELLVAIFGVLINLVEDTGNRTQLAAASVLLPDGGRFEEGKGGVVRLLFLSYAPSFGPTKELARRSMME
ncbi:hypothetical protein AMTR_s00013p00181170 [Amborella trichopoda]|uniref:Uncharacterized protein n=1 Tax=Amborella trichopoda TaxID=13333 RepID=W1PQD6_AMBTC|nr:hypothetical protein AMTR_s00013p00181170 [Amborella trichopoda]